MHTKNYTKTKPHKFYILTIFCFVLLSIFCLFSHPVSFASDTPPTLAEKICEKYESFFKREDIQEILPTVLDALKTPDSQKIITPQSIDIVVKNPDLLKEYFSDIDDEFIRLLKEDQEVKAFLSDTDVQTLLQDVAAIEELSTLILGGKLSLAEKVHERYLDLFQREDVKQQLPTLLVELKNPDIQALLNPATIQLVIDDPDILRSLLTDIDEGFITLLKEDAEIMTFINDPDVQLLLQDPESIDELAMLLDLPIPVVVTVKIVPASIVSPKVGEQVIITVDIANGIDVAGYQGTLHFDPTALQFVSLEHGVFLSDQTFNIQTMVMEDTVEFARIIAAKNVTASATEGTLVTVTFDVLDAKASMLSLSEVIISGLAGAQFQVIIENAEILEPPKTPWDVNNDGKVNILDLTFVASHFGAVNFPPEADVNGDGKVNILDLTTVASHFGETT